MINPPAEGLPQGAPLSAAPPAPKTSINVPIPDELQKEIVTICNKFKQSQITFAKKKKKKQRDAYAYAKSVFIGNDLLPIPKGDGTDRDMGSKRPQIFIPKTREQVKTLYSYLKLTLFPNDEDYFRIRAKSNKVIPSNQPALDPMGQPVIGQDGKPVMLPLMDNGVPVTYVGREELLTDGYKYLFKEALFTEKMGPYLQYLVEMGDGVAFPKIDKEKPVEWQLDMQAQQYVGQELDRIPLPDVEVWNPIHFYTDPVERNPDKAKWGYFDRKKVQEMKDSPYYFNTDDGRLDKLSTKQNMAPNDSQVRTTNYTDLNTQYEDIEPSVDYDLYYFPFLQVNNGQTFRNMLVGIAGGELMVRWHPSLSPRGKNPVVHCTWMNDTQSPYGIGPVEDMMQIQRLVNMIYNHATETLARIGNRFGVKEGTDLDSLWGVAGGVIVTKGNPNDEVAALTGNFAEISELLNFAGTLTAELQQVSGAQNPFQGSSQIDFKKTATELQILQENSISILREIVEHIAVMGIQRILELLMYLVAYEYSDPLDIRVDKPGMGPQFMEVDFSLIRSGQYTIELVGVNPSQSKQAQVETLTEFVQMIATNPTVLPILQPVLEKIALLEGLRDGPELLQKIIQIIQSMAPPAPPMPPEGVPNGAPHASVPPEATGMAPHPQPHVEGAPPAVA